MLATPADISLFQDVKRVPFACIDRFPLGRMQRTRGSRKRHGCADLKAFRRRVVELRRLQFQRRRVDAVAQAGGSRFVVEDVTEMAVAFRA